MAKQQYNLLRYNIGAYEQEINFTHHVSAAINAVVGGRIERPFLFSSSSEIENRTELRILIPFKHEPRTDFYSNIVYHLVILSNHPIGAEILAMVSLTKIMNFLQGYDTEILAATHVGKIISYEHILDDNRILAISHIGKVMNHEHDTESFIMGFVLMGLTKYATFVLDVTIPPRGEIRVDSDVFTAMMGQQNILHLFRGDWIYFERSIVQLVLDNSTGGQMAGEVLYNSRYI